MMKIRKGSKGVKEKGSARTLPRDNLTLNGVVNPKSETLPFFGVNSLSVLNYVSTKYKRLALLLNFNGHENTPPFCACEPLFPNGRLASLCHGRHTKARS